MFKNDKKKEQVKGKGVGNNLRVTRRDLELMKFVLEHGQLSSEMIYERFFRYGEDERKIKYMQNRISRLKKSGYVATHFSHDGPKKWVTVTAKGKSLVSGEFSDLGIRLKVFKELRLSQFSHDKMVAQLRIMLELECDKLNWKEVSFGEQAKGGLEPDGAFQILESRYFLELENVRKSHEYTNKKVSSYRSWSSRFEKNDKVVFICIYQSTLNNYKKAYRKKFDVLKINEYINDNLGSKSYKKMGLDKLDKERNHFVDQVNRMLKHRFLFVKFDDLVSLYEKKGRDNNETHLCKLIESSVDKMVDEVFEKAKALDRELVCAINNIQKHVVFSELSVFEKGNTTISEMDDLKAKKSKEEERLKLENRSVWAKLKG